MNDQRKAPQAKMPDGNKVWSEDLIITSKYNDVTLSRTVKLYMLNPYDMEVECNPSVVADNDINQPVTVNTIIPANLPSDIFPLVFDIEAAKLSLYPDPDATDVLGHTIVMPVVSGPSIINSSKNSFYYQRTLTYAEYEKLVENAGGATTVAIPSYFLTNMKNSETDVYVHNNYFETVNGTFSNYTAAKSFSNVAWSGDLVSYGVNMSGVFTFDTTDTSPVTITLSNANVTSLGDGITANGDGTYTATGQPSYTINITVTGWGDVPNAILTGDGYVSARAKATRNKLTIPANSLDATNNSMDYRTVTIVGGSGNIGFNSDGTNKAAEITISGLNLDSSLTLTYEDGYYYTTTYTADVPVSDAISTDTNTITFNEQ